MPLKKGEGHLAPLLPEEGLGVVHIMSYSSKKILYQLLHLQVESAFLNTKVKIRFDHHLAQRQLTVLAKSGELKHKEPVAPSMTGGTDNLTTSPGADQVEILSLMDESVALIQGR